MGLVKRKLTLGPPVVYLPRLLSLADYQRNPGLPIVWGYERRVEGSDEQFAIMRIQGNRVEKNK